MAIKDKSDAKREPTPNQGKIDFELFQSEFKKWQKLFGLTGYRVYFKCEPIVDSSVVANIDVSLGDMIATVTLNSELSAEKEPPKGIKKAAKHEAIHLLVGRLDQVARYRYSTKEEVYETTEELVNKLEDLIEG
ncbi:hypothetical protein LCGC14_0365360 [marine sediment metagenome]|uniref:Uncharacterized protein n=1 Tax=marine sediment metagenome TaxID=412755 RepID=A0A0F9T6P4_9ZZZZ